MGAQFCSVPTTRRTPNTRANARCTNTIKANSARRNSASRFDFLSFNFLNFGRNDAFPPAHHSCRSHRPSQPSSLLRYVPKFMSGAKSTKHNTFLFLPEKHRQSTDVSQGGMMMRRRCRHAVGSLRKNKSLTGPDGRDELVASREEVEREKVGEDVRGWPQREREKGKSQSQGNQ